MQNNKKMDKFNKTKFTWTAVRKRVTQIFVNYFFIKAGK